MVIQKKLKNIESVRFLFAVTIVYFHILNSNIIPFIGNNKLYLELQKSGFHQATIVECFFIISGYFLFQTLLHKPDLSISQFIVNKVVRLWPVLAFSIIISVIFGWVNRYEAIFQILFLQCIGISLDYKGINWYVSPFFWGIIGIFALIKIFKREKGSFFLAIAVYFSYVTNINYLNGTFGRDTIWNFLSLAMLRAIAGIGLGYFIGLTWETFSEKFNWGGVSSCSPSRVHIVLKKIWITLFECGLILLLVVNFFYAPYAYDNRFIIVVVFSLFFLCMISNQGFFSQLLSHEVLASLGKYSYSIYIMQQVSFNILKVSLWKNQVLIEKHVYTSLVLSVIFCIFIGVVTYYGVERLSVNIFYSKVVSTKK